MGSGSFDINSYRAYASTTAGKTTDEIYTSSGIDKDLNPKGVKLRESRDSKDNPNSTPLIVAIDVTGSMGMIADVIAREGLGVLFKEILEHKPITDPHLMFMAIGDVRHDEAPLQVSQFEADNRIVDQLTKIYLEHGGGGNNHESYDFPWFFAANHTEHDSYIKRAKRGYLFTVGDEQAPDSLLKDHINKFLGYKPEADQSSATSLADAQRTYDVFHIVIKEGDYASKHPDAVRVSWNKMLGQHVIFLSDHKKLAETIVSAITVAEGEDKAKIEKRYGSAVFDAVKALPKSRTPRLQLT